MTASANASVPSWLLNACVALDYLTADNPRAMSALSAILITVGAIPATLASIPGIAVGAGAAGTLLAGPTAQTVGAVAVGLGQALKSPHTPLQTFFGGKHLHSVGLVGGKGVNPFLHVNPHGLLHEIVS